MRIRVLRVLNPATSYSIGVNFAGYAYPLKLCEHLFLPYVLVFKDNSKHDFPVLNVESVYCISVISSPPPYRPQTNIIDQKTYEFDERLLHKNTKYKKPEIDLHLESMIELCLFLGYEILIFDDQGIYNYWLPAYDHITKLIAVLQKYKKKFKQLCICISDPKLYNIFSEVLNYS